MNTKPEDFASHNGAHPPHPGQPPATPPKIRC